MDGYKTPERQIIRQPVECPAIPGKPVIPKLVIPTPVGFQEPCILAPTAKDARWNGDSKTKRALVFE